MKLIEILVQELPNRGGWPKGQEYAWQDHNREVRFSNSSNNDFFPESGVLCHEYRMIGQGRPEKQSRMSVTREQYEAALAASKEMLVNKPVAWDGQGLPPLGTEVEYKFKNVRYRNDFSLGAVIAFGIEQVFIRHKSSGNEFIHPLKNIEFRPARSEAERKREDAVKAMVSHKDNPVPPGESYYHAIYDAIAAGKIPGVKLEAPDA